MSDNTEDPIMVHLRERKAELEKRITDATARLGEIDGLIDMLLDGRSRVRRRLKEVVTALPFVAGNGAEPDPPPAA